MGGELRFDMYQPEQITSAETSAEQTTTNMNKKSLQKQIKKNLWLKDLQTRENKFELHFCANNDALSKQSSQNLNIDDWRILSLKG